MASPENEHCANYIGTLSLPMASNTGLAARSMNLRARTSAVGAAVCRRTLETRQ